jgi:glycosyltransferase involved in cell wall biosynthesis
VSERTKVLMLVDALRPGGAERFLVGLAVGLPRDRYDVTVCATRASPGALADEVIAAGVRYETLGRSGRFDVTPFRRLVELLRDERYDVLHAHKFGSNLWGTVFGRLTRTPVVVAHEQTWSYEGQPLRRFLDGRVIGRAADAMVAVSTRDRERMTSVEGVPAAKTRYIPNAFMPPVGDPPEGDLRAELGIPAGTPVVGTLSVHRPQKALDVLIDAFAIVAERMPEARLVIGGDGPMTEQWRARAGERGIGDRTHWIGLRSDGAAVLRGYDVAAMSSDFEGTPLFAFECMAARTPMVATDVGGFRDIFESGRSALLVPPRDPGAMADAIEQLLRDPARRAAVADAAYARLPEFSVERAVERVGALYDELLAQRRGDRVRTPATAGVAG